MTDRRRRFVDQRYIHYLAFSVYRTARPREARFGGEGRPPLEKLLF
jgi:hypothetical protein